jgi:hypothetical protein
VVWEEIRLIIESQKVTNARNVLSELTVDEAKLVIADYIKSNHLEIEYADVLVQIIKNYAQMATDFIVRFKQDVNVLYVDHNFGHSVLENVDIDEKNWFWFARLLRESEDEVYPTRNYLQPTYLLERLKPIIEKIDLEKIKGYSDLEELYQICLNLMKKYNV